MNVRGVLVFKDTFQKRIWGGHKLREVYAKDTPNEPIGEDWLISDHARVESVVSEGPLGGLSLHDLMERDAREILGRIPKLTPNGRFPLLLKLLDAADVLSVQVHPDDEEARALGEIDTGKTEMWHVLYAEGGAELICGLDPGVKPAGLREAVDDGTVERLLVRHRVEEGTSLLVPAGAVHTIGSGVMVAEIQQNSDITYRLYDWNRVDDEGNPRELHVDKALKAVHFGSPPPEPATPLAYECDGARCQVLAACPYFAAELIRVEQRLVRRIDGRSFHILLVKQGAVHCEDTALGPGEAALVPGIRNEFEISGNGAVLDYYVPDLVEDVVKKLQDQGHRLEQIKALGAGTF